MGVSRLFRLNAEIPKYQIEVYQKESKTQRTFSHRSYEASDLKDRTKIGAFSFEGLKVYMMSKGNPYKSTIEVAMDKLSVQDPNVLREVMLVNQPDSF